MHIAHIVVVEDEPDILELIEFILQKEGFDVTGFLRPQKVIDFLCEEQVDLLIVDRNLPHLEGSDLVRQIRDLRFDMPVIFLTAKDKESELEEGFLSGGDDYMSKPFSAKELVLRIKALLRRSGKLHSQYLSHRDIRLDLSQKRCYIGDAAIDLTPLEFKLLSTFIKFKSQLLEKEFLRQEVWGDEAEDFGEKTIAVALNRLKKKIDPSGAKNYIEAVRGIGYRMV